jgi:hypothetical protein
MVSTSVRGPKPPRSGVPRPTYLAETSRDVSNRNPDPSHADGEGWASVVGQLGFRKATLSVPSTFYAGEEFPPATANVEFPKSGLSRGGLTMTI